MITIYVATVFCFHKSTESERSLSAAWLSICDVMILTEIKVLPPKPKYYWRWTSALSLVWVT